MQQWNHHKAEPKGGCVSFHATSGWGSENMRGRPDECNLGQIENFGTHGGLKTLSRDKYKLTTARRGS